MSTLVHLDYTYIETTNLIGQLAGFYLT